MRQLQIVDSQGLGHFKKKKSFAKVEDWTTQIFHDTNHAKILPAKQPVSELIIRHHLHLYGLWKPIKFYPGLGSIIGSSMHAVSAVKHVLSTCHVCKRQKAKLIPGQTANFSWVEPNTCTLNQVNEKFGVWINSESLFQYGTAQPFFLPTPAWNLDFESNLERLWFRRQTFMYRT